MVRLKNKKHKRILYDKLIESLGKQIPDRWERKMFHRMVGNTVIRSVEELESRKGWKTEGTNVHHVVIGPRGAQYVGPVEIYVPRKTLERLKGLESGNVLTKGRAEEALHTVSHEFAHDYFKSINYEARLTRYLRDNPKVVERYMQRFLGRAKDPKAEERAKKLVGENPLFWSNYVAHTAHEAGADIMAAETVAQIAEGRHANAMDLERLTAFRPFTIREFIRIKEGERIPTRKPKKPGMLESLSRGIEYTSMDFMDHMGRFDAFSHPTKARMPPKSEMRRIFPEGGRHRRAA